MARHLTVTEAEAARNFAGLLRAAKSGQRVTITNGETPVAELRGTGAKEQATHERDARAEARKTIERRWAGSGLRVVGPWTRDELYERD